MQPKQRVVNLYLYQMRRLIDLGVDAMETDYPAALNSLMPPRDPGNKPPAPN